MTDERDRPDVSAKSRAGRLTTAGRQGLTIRRLRSGRGFSYRDETGEHITKATILARIRSLAVPPAYEDVRISSDPNAHLQAVGRDEAGRLQYRYHRDWEVVREARKARRLAGVADALPRLRAAMRRDLALPGVGRRMVLALAVALIDRTSIRVGGDAYARANGGRGAATLLKRDVRLTGGGIRLNFRGKGGKTVECDIEDAALARTLSAVMRLPGRRMLQYRAEDGTVHRIGAADINAYLRDATGVAISAKDLRMLAGSVLAAEILVKVEPAPQERAKRRQLAEVMRVVSERLGNTPAVARKSYVHVVLVDAFMAGALKRLYRATEPRRNMRRVEQMLHRLAGRARSRRQSRVAAAVLPIIQGGSNGSRPAP
ncbi:DNA topoisomerase IB [Phreatobacter stygius]|uniref:DNA topoisomerase IB n=1 Tax=Phreatobacter stygius TaxID=1940610 RepID=A0A4D7BL80_9HYPH|nr:DNA topoisomerase IB [Phreatobacter stygius]QCI68492.1 DNA topoisomerase IB [Phreatobacter stygius]